MTEIDAINACADPDLLKRVAFSLSKTATTIHGETAGPRTVLAAAVLADPRAYALRFLINALATLSAAALAALTTPASISQASIDSQMAAIWNNFAG